MTAVVQSIITIVLFIAILGILVVIHEIGHFVTARLANVRVLEFGIGFPPRAKVLRENRDTKLLRHPSKAIELRMRARAIGRSSDLRIRAHSRCNARGKLGVALQIPGYFLQATADRAQEPRQMRP